MCKAPCKGEDEGEGPCTASYFESESRFCVRILYRPAFFLTSPRREGRASGAGEGQTAARMPDASHIARDSGFCLCQRRPHPGRLGAHFGPSGAKVPPVIAG